MPGGVLGTHLHLWVPPWRGLGSVDPTASAGGFPWGDGAWDAVFALEVITELHPFPSHPFPSLGLQPPRREATGSRARAT